MALSRRRADVVSALAIILLFALAGCAAPVTAEDAGGTPTASASPEPTETTESPADGEADEGGDDPGKADSDGGEDPAQDRVRTGPVAQYGGPAYGDQGTAEVIDDGLWCKTIAVFWGGDEAVPDGVSFTFLTAATSRQGLRVEGGVCGSRGATHSCLGLRVEANESGVFCSLVLRPGPDFQDGTAITFAGRLECPTSQVCDQVAARAVEPGPPIIVDDPEPSGEQQDGEQDDEQQPDESPDPGQSPQPGEESR